MISKCDCRPTSDYTTGDVLFSVADRPIHDGTAPLKAWRNLIIHVSAEVILHVSQSSRVADAVDRRHQSFKLKSWRCRRPGKEGAVRPSLLVSDEQARAGCEARTAVLHSALVISGTSYIAFEATPINLGMIVCPSTRFVHYRCCHGARASREYRRIERCAAQK